MKQEYQKNAACKAKSKEALLSVLKTPTNKFSRKKINIVDTVLRYSLRYPFNYLSQNRIATESGCGKTLVCEVMTKLEEFFFKQERRFKNNREIPSQYYLNPIFRTKEMLKELAQYLPSLRRIPSLWIETLALTMLISGHPSVSFIDQYYQDFDNRELSRYIYKNNKKVYRGRKSYNEAKPIGNFLKKVLNGEKDSEVKRWKPPQRERQCDLATQILIQEVKDSKTMYGLDILDSLLQQGLL